MQGDDVGSVRSDISPRFLRRLNTILHHLSPFEWILFGVLAIAFIGSVLSIIWQLNTNHLLTSIPARGGSLTEGMVGSPRFVNPLLAVSDTDKSLSELMYAGLMRATPNGTLEPELAAGYEISDDGKTYTFTLRQDATFHDGAPVTAEDVVFTIKQAQSAAIKSPQRASWTDVAVERVDSRTVKFTLNEPYSPFLENTTIGILPKHLWTGTSAEEFQFSRYNTEPVGAGPYTIASIKRNDSGVPVRYELEPFQNYVDHPPYIDDLTIRFYADEQQLVRAYRNGEVNSASGISPTAAQRLEQAGKRVERAPLMRVFGVYYNQNEADVLTNEPVRRALDIAVNRHRLVETVLLGYGTPINGPVPPNTLDTVNTIAQRPSTSTIQTAQGILEDAGWTYSEENSVYQKDGEPLTFTVATADTPALRQAGERITQTWQRVGANVDLNIYANGDLSQSVIRPRSYDALLFGQIIGRGLDLYAFWHSSQRNDPGLNVAMYANVDADEYLEQARKRADPEERATQYKQFIEEVRADAPATFLYSPDFLYAVPKQLQGLELGSVTSPGDRFLNIHDWYTKTDRVWTFFAT
jgi:peptide/nickel transport system substrate-binding protein